AIRPPAWLGSPAARDLPFANGRGKRGDVHLPVTGFVRGVGEPISIGRNLSICLVRVFWEQGHRIAAVHREEVQPVLSYAFAHKTSPSVVRRPGVRDRIFSV